ncbi:hypothetical protein HK097_008973 [Rhizophlyctis rosea]|uniref:Peptidase S74 domain-containing protein n=1 Tax=Rhizophlyctis rosea TaxID=64517 RepID=A0AAD5X1D1_9FUNG|nr:hypothetical protein HK097_008973 [Rhizophlyctis rosea]
MSVEGYRFMNNSSGTNWTGYFGTATSAPVAMVMGRSRIVIQGGEINIVSSCKRKEHIQEIQGALKAIRRIPAVTFNYIDDPSKKQTHGFIAEEVAEVFPQHVEVFVTPDDEQTLTLNQAPLLGVLWKGMQEMMKWNEELVERIQTLESIVKDL